MLLLHLLLNNIAVANNATSNRPYHDQCSTSIIVLMSTWLETVVDMYTSLGALIVAYGWMLPKEAVMVSKY